MLISKKLENYSLLKNNKPNTTISPTKKYLSFGSKYSWIVMSLVRMLKKETSLFWDTSRKLKLENLKIWRSFGLISTSQKTNGSLTKNFTKNFSLTAKSSRRALEIKSNGKKERTLQLKSWKRKTKRKEDKKKPSRSNKNHSLISSSTLKSTVMKKMKIMRREINKSKIWSYNTRLLNISMRILFQSHLSTIWDWLKLWTIWVNLMI